MMNIVTDIKEWQIIRKEISNKSLGFVPTMGHLHEGHLSLVKRSLSENDVTIVSIFVNPTQFNQATDFEFYPRTFEQDQALLATTNIDYLLYPSAEAIYADGYEIKVVETNISSSLEGEFRPGHFNGMLTVVLKLLNLIYPSRIYLGEKDYQQFLLIKKMVTALFIPTEVVACETIRAEDRLALSSRNSRLSLKQRQIAAHFPRLLQSSLSLTNITQQLKALGFKVDYIAEQWQRRLGAVWLDDVRLIDNIPL